MKVQKENIRFKGVYKNVLSSMATDLISENTERRTEQVLGHVLELIDVITNSFHVRGGKKEVDLFVEGFLLNKPQNMTTFYIDNIEDITDTVAYIDIHVRAGNVNNILLIKGDGRLLEALHETGITGTVQYVFAAYYGNYSRHSEQCHDGAIHFSHIEEKGFGIENIKEDDVIFMSLTDFSDRWDIGELPTRDKEYNEYMNELGLGNPFNVISQSPNHLTQNISSKNHYQRIIDKIFRMTLSSFINPIHRRNVYIVGPRFVTGKTAFITTMQHKSDFNFGDELNADYEHVVLKEDEVDEFSVLMLDDDVPSLREPNYNFMSLLSPSPDKMEEIKRAMMTSGTVYITTLPSIINHMMSDDQRPLYINLNDFVTVDYRPDDGKVHPSIT